MLRDEPAQQLRQLRADGTLKPADRDRVALVAWSAAGWPVGRIAAPLGDSAQTVRGSLRRWRPKGWAMVRHEAPGPTPDPDRRTNVATALRALLSEHRPWTAGPLAEAVREQGIALRARQTRRELSGLGSGWRRTQRPLLHQQAAGQVAQAEAPRGR